MKTNDINWTVLMSYELIQRSEVAMTSIWESRLQQEYLTGSLGGHVLIRYVYIVDFT